jgi:hypothetical protein
MFELRTRQSTRPAGRLRHTEDFDGAVTSAGIRGTCGERLSTSVPELFQLRHLHPELDAPLADGHGLLLH